MDSLGQQQQPPDTAQARATTETLAAWLVASRYDDIPADVHNQAKRALLNVLGCTLGGSREPGIETLIRTMAPFAGPPTAAIIARPERVDPLLAALVNGTEAHVHEYDDTLPRNYMHPSPPLASALFAYASANPVSGRDFVHAFVLGFEAEARIANAVYPAHYDAGWHITCTAGVFGAAAAIGKLLGLPLRETVWSLGLAATQAAGIREMFGSMAKFWHAGRAAQNGYTAALLAQAGFTAGEHALEGPRGFAAVQAAHYDLARVTDRLGEDFELRVNAYKPYPCGIVVHPTIDGCIGIHREHRPPAEAIESVRVRVAPLVLDLCNKREFRRALDSKYSIYHAAAIGLVRGRAGIEEFDDDAVRDPVLARVRERVVPVADPTITEDQSHIEVELSDGRRLTQFVEASLGNLNRPLDDAQLEHKFLELATRVGSQDWADRMLALCRDIDRLDDVGELVRASGEIADTRRRAS
jgi:2-methylcitrate dehydratase PrpD